MPVVLCDPAKKRTHRNAVLTELREMQELVLADCRDPETPAAARAQLMRAYDVLEERKRIIRMQPKPRDVDVGVKGRSKRAVRASLVPMPQASAQDGPVPGASAPTA